MINGLTDCLECKAYLPLFDTSTRAPSFPIQKSPGLPREAFKGFLRSVYAVMRLQFGRRMSEHHSMSSRELKPVQKTLGETAPKDAETQKKILVIDDDPVTVKALTLALTSQGYAVFSARDGSEAISVVRDDVPDMLLVDVNLEPTEGIDGAALWDGFQVTRWLRHVTATKIPAIIMSTSDKPDYRTYAAKIGAETFMAKPISKAALLQSIEARFAGAAATSRNQARL